MPRKIEVTVDRHGRITVDFIGFQGKECEDEAEMLRRALRSMGLVALPLQVSFKSEEQMAGEAREEQEERETPSRQVGAP